LSADGFCENRNLPVVAFWQRADPMDDQKRFRTRDAARYVGLSASTLEKFRVMGRGPAYRKLGKKLVIYLRSDLDAWLDQCRRTSTSEPS
jgi:predicted DNA-binding transcriptional regulator AlpA